MRVTGWIGKWIVGLLGFLFFSSSVVWGFYPDQRREMNLTGFLYTRGTWALSNDEIGAFKGLWQRGNLVQHRNFATLEWRHNLNRITREVPALGPVFRSLNLGNFDYYLRVSAFRPDQPFRQQFWWVPHLFGRATDSSEYDPGRVEFWYGRAH
jgi:hypothetical protein